MKGMIFGAGSVGRGFVGELLGDMQAEICFVDVVEEVINGINEKHEYPHITVFNEEEEIKYIKNVKAISSFDEQTVIREMKQTDFIATSLGAKVLGIVAPLMAKGITERLKESGRSINILLCENLHDVDKIMHDLLLPHIPEDLITQFEQKVGLLSTSIGRMIPVSSEETKILHPAAIKVEPYKFLPFNGKAIKGDFPHIDNLIWDESVSFDFYADRKLYLHNMGHSMTAYLANFFGYEFIWEAIENPNIRYFVRSAMLEAAIALSQMYQQPLNQLVAHVDDLLRRFANKALQDTCARVGREPDRKLKANDRLFGAYFTCLDQSIIPKHISLGVAAGLMALLQETGMDEAGLNRYLQNEVPHLFNTENEQHCQRLSAQINALRKGFDFSEQIEIISRFSEKKII